MKLETTEDTDKLWNKYLLLRNDYDKAYWVRGMLPQLINKIKMLMEENTDLIEQKNTIERAIAILKGTEYRK